MADLVIQPTRKYVRFKYTTVIIAFCIAVFLHVNYLEGRVTGWWLIAPALLFVWPIAGEMRRRFTKITITGDKLHYDSGVIAKTTRTIQVSKVQDVRVDQSVWQRLMGVGTLSIETAGETSRLTIADIDDPRAVADQLVEASQSAPQPPPQKRKGERV